MHARSIIAASILHGALVVGVGLSVHPWAVDPQIPVRVAVSPAVPETRFAREPAIPEDIEPPPPAPDAEFAEPEPVPPRDPDRADDREPEPEPRTREPVFAATRPWPRSTDLMVRVRRVPVEVPTKAPTEAPTAADLQDPATAVVTTALVEAVPCADRNQPPRYPREAKRRGVSGEVILLVTVATDGEVRKVDLLRSAGRTRWHRRLDRAAIAAVSSWRYHPALRDGVPVEARIRVPIEFRLR